jgi:two-component system, response regulator
MRRVVDILIVDASDRDTALTLEALRRAASGVSAFRLTDGEQALQFICATGGYADRPGGPPKLVLLELFIPSVSGLAVLESLRACPATLLLPVVLWTASSNVLFVEQGRQAGASAYHVKPSDPQRYRAEIDTIVKRWLPGAAASSQISAAAERVDSVSQ